LIALTPRGYLRKWSTPLTSNGDLQGDWEGTRTVYETEIELVEMHVLRAEKEKRESGMPNDFMTIATGRPHSLAVRTSKQQR
jgi:hypothetical protein